MSVALKAIAGLVFLFVVFTLALFLSAGTVNWLAGWVFLVLFFSFDIAITSWLFKHNPGLLNERTAMSSSDQKAWDRFFFVLLNASFIVWLILMPLDAVRFHWSQGPIWLQIVGALLLLGSFYLFFLTFRTNSYLSPLVRIQEERGQTVVVSGPYHYVRHPMYAAALLFLSGTALLLGSWYGLLWAVILIGILARRAILEERTLQAELQGYDAYMVEVKYRLIPYIW